MWSYDGCGKRVGSIRSLLGEVDVALFVVDFFSFPVAHKQDGGAEEEDSGTPRDAVSPAEFPDEPIA